jgi:DNA-binding transcriptional ArsR family regulator
MSIIVAGVGPEIEDLYAAVREFPTDKVILITYPETKKEAEKALKELGRFKVAVEVAEAGQDIWEDTFRIVHGVGKAYEGKDVLINVSSGDKISRCALTSAAFVNGMRAFAVSEGVISMLPVLKFSYYKLITDRKMRMLEALFYEKDCCSSLDELAKKTGMSLPLVSYHVNGNPRSQGLKEMGLVETVEGKKTSIKLSLMGRILMKGYVEPKEEK